MPVLDLVIRETLPSLFDWTQLTLSRNLPEDTTFSCGFVKRGDSTRWRMFIWIYSSPHKFVHSLRDERKITLSFLCWCVSIFLNLLLTGWRNYISASQDATLAEMNVVKLGFILAVMLVLVSSLALSTSLVNLWLSFLNPTGRSVGFYYCIVF